MRPGPKAGSNLRTRRSGTHLSGASMRPGPKAGSNLADPIAPRAAFDCFNEARPEGRE